MEATTLTRSIAGAGVVFVLGIGGWTGSRLGLDTKDKVELALARKVAPERAQAEALKKTASYQDSEAFYQTLVDETVARNELAPVGLAKLLESNTFYQPVTRSDPKQLSPGSTLSEAGFEIAIRVEEIEVERRGTRTKYPQTMAILRNGSDKPLAYYLSLRGTSGDCGVRALTRYDAMLLMPGESAEISVCAGTHDVEIVDWRMLELTEVGAAWVGKIPPQAIGLEDLAARSHFPGSNVVMCSEMPIPEFNRLLASGESQWEDIIDFYSRHDCDHYQWWSGYRRSAEPLSRLPAQPEG